MTAEPAATIDGTQYSYRGALAGAGWQFRLAEGGIDWSAGPRSGHVPFTKVRRVRMRFRPMSMQANRYVTEVWAEGAPKLTIVSTTLKGLFEQTRLDAEYTAFVGELHRRIAASGAPVLCTKGNHPLLYWPAVALYGVILLGLAILTVRALLSESDLKVAALFIVAFAGLFAWQGGNFLRRNRPGVYRADAPPAELLPGSPRTTSTEHLA